MTGAERRIIPRRELRVPLRFRTLGSNSAQIGAGESLNFSERGLFFVTSQALEVGTPIEVFLTLPQEAGRPAASEVRCTARVVHVRADAHRNGYSGVGAQFDRFETTAARVAWQS
jgi:hypothetical protein